MYYLIHNCIFSLGMRNSLPFSTQHRFLLLINFTFFLPLLPLYSHPSLSCLPPHPFLSASSISPAHSNTLGRCAFCSVLLPAMCSSSQLVFPLIYSSFISGRHTYPRERGGGGAAVMQLMLSAGGHFIMEFRGPVWSKEGPDQKGLTWGPALWV